MDKPAIKKFAIWARKKLIADTKYRAGLVGVTETAVAEPLPQSNETVQFFDVGLPQPYRIEGDAVTQRQRFVAELNKETAKQGSYTAAYQTVVDKVAYTWFNRLIAVRYMEVNDLLPSRTRVLSSADGRAEPQIVTSPFDAVLDYTPAEQQQIVTLKNDNKLDEAFRLLFLKQCAALGDCLPRLFEQVDDYMPLLLALSFTDKDGVVCHLVNDIPEANWKEELKDADNTGKDKTDINAVQIVGWLYQDYNTEDNELVYDGTMSKSRIPKELLPAATTIYTPDWATRYMVQNTLGRLWCEGHPNFAKPENWKYYLTEAPQTQDTQQKLAEIRKGYAELQPEEIKVIDPCSGSGHILVHMFDTLMQIYNSVGYSDRDAVRSIIENNLYGLDVSDRAAQLSYFAVMMKARRYDKRFLTRKDENGKPDVPQAKVYAIHESGELSDKQWKDVFAEFDNSADRDTVKYLADAFADAKEYGSILKLNCLDYAHTFQTWKDIEVNGTPTFTYYVVKDTVTALLEQAIVLTQKYDVVVTNPPYLASSRFSPALDTYVKKNYLDEKADLSAIMFKKAATDFVKPNGFVSFITTSSWMFLSSFEKFRTFMMRNMALDSIVDFGTELFDGKVGHNPIAAWVNRNTKMDFKMTAIRLVDYCYSRRDEKEPEFFKDRNRYVAEQDNFSKIPGSPVAYWASENAYRAFVFGTVLEKIAQPKQGMVTRDNTRFMRLWWEIAIAKMNLLYVKCHEESLKNACKWYPCTTGGAYRKWYGNNESVVNFERDGEEIIGFSGSHIKNREFYFRENITWSAISSSKVSMRYTPSGYLPEHAGNCLYGKSNDLCTLQAICNSCVGLYFLGILSPTLNYNVGDIARIPIVDAESVQEIINDRTQNARLISKNDWDSFETSWDFKKHPLV